MLPLQNQHVSEVRGSSESTIDVFFQRLILFVGHHLIAGDYQIHLLAINFLKRCAFGGADSNTAPELRRRGILSPGGSPYLF